jgi:hypothetical protein
MSSISQISFNSDPNFLEFKLDPIDITVVIWNATSSVCLFRFFSITAFCSDDKKDIIFIL